MITVTNNLAKYDPGSNNAVSGVQTKNTTEDSYNVIQLVNI